MQKELKWLLKEKYFGKPTKKFYKDVKRLNSGEPLDYVIGFTDFLGCKIDLSKKPLIPRPETELWTEQAIKDILTFLRMSECFNGRKIKILDIFAGSGCIGLAILKHIYCATIDFSDKNNDCLQQIEINCKLNKINLKRYKIIKSDIFSNIKKKYDFILANPPYVAKKKINRVQKSVLKYEPKQALFAGKDGLFYIKKFLKQAKNYLNYNGKIFMEFSPEQKNKIKKILEKYKYSNFEFYKDQFDKWRWVSAS